MNCPKCKDKKSRPVRVDPVSRKCPKCKVSLYVDHAGKTIVRGVSARTAAQPAPAPAGEKTAPH
ncbi:MAG: hypothetical protein HYY17_01595 [Planctomycetes bacterium]|nr:hypothetical protein [Planctomycetota bacterium]